MTPGTDAQRIAELEEDNRRLRRLLDQRDAPGELRHRLRSTLALLRAVIRRSADTGRDLPGYVAQLEDRVEAIARAQAQADQHGEVDLGTILADELLHYSAREGETIRLSGPGLRLQPRAGQILALAIHELAVNAVEHGALGTDEGRLDVTWEMVPGASGASVLLSWTEFVPTLGPTSGQGGFGMEVLGQMLPYELKAETNVALGQNGLRCTMCFPLLESTGRLVPG